MLNESTKTYLKLMWNHFKVITKHKWIVLIECWKRYLFWQGLVHDLSKYSWTEFAGSARYFQGDSTPIAAEKREKGYSLCWLHHKGRNKHHWEYWTDFVNGVITPIPIPDKYISEMLCDMIAADKVYNGGVGTLMGPYIYFINNKDNWCMTEESMNKLEKMLYDYAQAR